MYLAGFLGMQFSVTRPLFLQLTSFNLWVSTLLLLFFHELPINRYYEKAKGNKANNQVGWDNLTISYFIAVALLGFIIEVIGVKTGKIFGVYQYGNTLGFKVFTVPISIGLNWLMLTYLFSYFTQKILQKVAVNPVIIAAVSAFFMVIFDFFIEKVAIKFDFWAWQDNVIPLQNYLGWYVTSFFFCYLFLVKKIIYKNNIAGLLLTLQILFFVFHNLAFNV